MPPQKHTLIFLAVILIAANAQEILKLIEDDWNSGGIKEIMDENTYLELKAYTEKMASE